jgi:hypothetical protein
VIGTVLTTQATTYDVKYISKSIPADNLANERVTCLWRVENGKIKHLFKYGGYKERFQLFKQGSRFFFDTLPASSLGSHSKREYSKVKFDLF